MKVLIVCAVAAAALLAGATGILRSRLPAHVETAAMPPMQQLQSGAGVDRLPADDFEDRSLVYPREPKY